jgi:hypothetical protein
MASLARQRMCIMCPALGGNQSRISWWWVIWYKTEEEEKRRAPSSAALLMPLAHSLSQYGQKALLGSLRSSCQVENLNKPRESNVLEQMWWGEK